jgi:hypothetical protein
VTAWPAEHRHGFVATALARAEAWFLSPADAPLAAERLPPAPPPARPVVAVVGLAPGCGATAVARALAVELALRDPGGAAVVVSERVQAGPLAVAGPASARLARTLRALGYDGVRSAGRLCLLGELGAVAPRLVTEPPAPLVLDAGRDGAGAALADRTVLVAGRGVEPALALVVAASFERTTRAPALVANRIEEVDRWEAIGALPTGESRLAAGLALAGREPRGALGAAMRELVDRWERAGW